MLCWRRRLTMWLRTRSRGTVWRTSDYWSWRTRSTRSVPTSSSWRGRSYRTNTVYTRCLSLSLCICLLMNWIYCCKLTLSILLPAIKCILLKHQWFWLSTEFIFSLFQYYLLLTPVRLITIFYIKSFYELISSEN